MTVVERKAGIGDGVAFDRQTPVHAESTCATRHSRESGNPQPAHAEEYMRFRVIDRLLAAW